MIRPVLLALAAGALVAGCSNTPVTPAASVAPPPMVAPVAPLPTAAPPITVADPPTTTTRSTTSSRAPRTTRTTPTEDTDDQDAREPSSASDVSYRCTNRIDYSNDPRSNAELNSIGAETGSCPTPREPESSGETQLAWLCEQGITTEGC